MRVAFCNRPTWNAPLGGDGVQMLKTKEYLLLVHHEICRLGRQLFLATLP